MDFMSIQKKNEYSLLVNETFHQASVSIYDENLNLISVRVDIFQSFIQSQRPYFKIGLSTIVENSTLFIDKKYRYFYFNKKLTKVFCKALKLPNMHISCTIFGENITLRLSRTKNKVISQ